MGLPYFNYLELGEQFYVPEGLQHCRFFLIFTQAHFLIKLNLFTKHYEELTSHPESHCIWKSNPEDQTLITL